MQSLSVIQNVGNQGNLGSSGDIISMLPLDKSKPSQDEEQIVDILFKEEQGVVNKVLENSKDVLLVGILYTIFSLNCVDEIIKRFIPMTSTSEYILLGIKAVLFMIIYFIFINLVLSRNQG